MTTVGEVGPGEGRPAKAGSRGGPGDQAGTRWEFRKENHGRGGGSMDTAGPGSPQINWTGEIGTGGPRTDRTLEVGTEGPTSWSRS